MAKIKEIRARQILNGAGDPTIETTVILSDGRFGIASVPSAASAGNYEAVELRDSNYDDYGGRSVLQAIGNIERTIAPALIGMEAGKQQEVDRKMIELDGTSNKSKLGANAILSVSIAVAKAAAQSSLLPLFLYLREYIKKDALVLKTPTPVFNMLSGNLENGADFEDFSIFPPTYKNCKESMVMAYKIFQALKSNLKTQNLSTLVSDFGGLSPNISNNESALNLLKESIEATNQRLGFDVFIGLDPCADNFYKEGKYKIKDHATPLSAKDLSSFYLDICKRFNVLYIEDPFSSDDLDSWAEFTTASGAQTLAVGDNLVATNPYRLQVALGKKALNAIAVKPLQIGTVIESLAVVEVARTSGLKIIPSVRSQETNDDFIADFATAVSADYVRFGSLSRGEMVAKYNRLAEIDSQIKSL